MVQTSMTPHLENKRCRREAFVIASILMIASVVLALSSSSATGQMTAHAARVLSGTDTAHLHLVHSGETLLEEGPTSGSLAGRMRAELRIGPIYTGSFTIYTHNGRITGSGRANPHGSGRYQSFAGTLTITSGSGLYAHVHGRDGLYGVFDRRSYAVVVTTTGRLSY
jgi:hypothetical protein